MKTFLRWLNAKIDPEVENRQKVDAAIYLAFTGPSGKLVLDYLIASHYAMVTPPTMLDQCEYNEGRRLVVQDLLDAMDRYRNGTDLNIETE